MLMVFTTVKLWLTILLFNEIYMPLYWLMPTIWHYSSCNRLHANCYVLHVQHCTWQTYCVLENVTFTPCLKEKVPTYTPNSELTAKLLRGMESDPPDDVIQHTVGWNPGDLLYKPVLQVRAGHDTHSEEELITRPSPLSSVGLPASTAKSGDKSGLVSNSILMSSCCKQIKVKNCRFPQM